MIPWKEEVFYVFWIERSFFYLGWKLHLLRFILSSLRGFPSTKKKDFVSREADKHVNYDLIQYYSLEINQSKKEASFLAFNKSSERRLVYPEFDSTVFENQTKNPIRHFEEIFKQYCIGDWRRVEKEKSLKVQSEKSRDDLSNVNHRITYLGCCKAGSAFYWSLLSLPSPSLWVLLNLSATIFTRCNLSNGAKNQIVSRVSASLFGHRLHTLYIASQISISHLK